MDFKLEVKCDNQAGRFQARMAYDPFFSLPSEGEGDSNLSVSNCPFYNFMNYIFGLIL